MCVCVCVCVFVSVSVCVCVSFSLKKDQVPLQQHKDNRCFKGVSHELSHFSNIHVHYRSISENVSNR